MLALPSLKGRTIMSKFTDYIGSQFGNPRGFVGKVCCIIMNVINTVYFWSDTVKGLSEIRRVLKPGATFYNVVYTREWLDKLSYTKKGFKKFEPELLMDFGRQAGFENVQIKDIVKGKSFVVIYTKA